MGGPLGNPQTPRRRRGGDAICGGGPGDGHHEVGWSVARHAVSTVRKYFARKLPADQLRHNSGELEAMFPDVWTRNLDGKVFEEMD